MTTLSNSPAASRPAFLENDGRFGTPLQLLSSNPSTWELLAEPQHYDLCVIWVLNLCHDRPSGSTTVMKTYRDTDDRSGFAEVGVGLSSRAEVVLDGTCEVIAVDETPSRRPGWLHRLMVAIGKTWASLQRAREIRQSMSMLSRMDDRALQDLGIDRSEIEYAVRHGRKWG
jgi:uncharacterized protein YjiS (DUF1127 family)